MKPLKSAIELLKANKEVEAIELLNENFNYVSKEGNDLGIYACDDTDKSIFFIRKADLKIFELIEDWKHEVMYSGTDVTNYSIQIFKNKDENDEAIWSNVNWNESVIYYDESYPDWLKEEWENEKEEEENA